MIDIPPNRTGEILRNALSFVFNVGMALFNLLLPNALSWLWIVFTMFAVFHAVMIGLWIRMEHEDEQLRILYQERGRSNGR
jgi:hypothetical protein